MASANETPSSPGGRSFGYLYDAITAAKTSAAEMEAMWENDASVSSLAAQASLLEDRFCELRVKLYQIAETIDA